MFPTGLYVFFYTHLTKTALILQGILHIKTLKKIKSITLLSICV
jgi:hypothetical protein